MYEKPVVDNMNPTRASTLGTETWFDMYYIVWGANVAVGVTAVGAYELVFVTFAATLPLSEQDGTSNES
jgi:hypothetical protein